MGEKTAIQNRGLVGDIIIRFFYMVFIFRVKRKIKHLYYKFADLYPVWFYVLNHRARKTWKKPELNPCQKQIVDSLNMNGIAVSHISNFISEEEYKNLKESANERLKTAKVSESKDFWLTFPGENVLPKGVLEVVSSYLKMQPWFRELTFTYTLITNKPPTGSQRWHRDPDDKKMIKLFLYLNDVDKETGPFMYIKGTHYTGRWRKIFPQIRPVGRYPKDKEVEKIIPESDMLTCLGREGTLIFADTSGLHKGRYSLNKNRIMGIFRFTSYAA